MDPDQSSLDSLGLRLQAALGDGYEVERQLGSGGMAVVYAVRDLSLKRPLAVKVLSPDLIATHSALARFRREAETIAQLSHPNIVPLHFIGERDDLVYLAMAAIDGGTLSDRLEREGPLPVAEATRILGEVASALAHAHKRGVIHRDIKPDNVLLEGETGRALVTDFGIARTADGGALTATGMVVGTAGYLSPEQINGEASDSRGDIYALGVMGYQLLAGRLPFEGPTPVAILMRRLSGPAQALGEIRPDVPGALSDIIESCLAVDAADRPGDAAEIVRALATVSPAAQSSSAHSPPGGAMTARRNERGAFAQRWTKLTVGAAIVIIAAAAVARFGRPGAKAVGQATATSPTVDSAMVLVPAGQYSIGTSNGPEATRPAHLVPLAAFGLDAREVTVGDYDNFVQAVHAPTPWTGPRPPGALPATGVTLDEAGRYCAWRHPGRGRLPTEEEWEAAARGTDGRLYPWGNLWDPQAANTGMRSDGAVPVGSHPRGRSPLGFDDLIGNVWEWTSSPFKPYGSTAPAAAAAPPGADLYVIRGGGYNSVDSVATASFRGRARQRAQRSELAATGFRCAMTVSAINDASTTPR